jgi:hypothetical protein
MDLNQTRYISITLTEPEWEGLRALQPDPCRWLKQQVHQLLEENGRPVESRATAPADPRSVEGHIA